MIQVLENIAQLYNVMTMKQYIQYLGYDSSQYYSTMIICTTKNIPLQKYHHQKPIQYLFQKVTQQWETNHNYVQQCGFLDSNKNCKYIVLSRKLFISKEMEELYALIGTLNMDFLINNFIILLNEPQGSETYIQISGEPLMTLTRKQSQKESKIQREKIVYCNHMSRKAGLFKKNFISIAKKQISQYIESKNMNFSIDYKVISIKATSNLIDKFKLKIQYSDSEIIHLRPILERLIFNMQNYDYSKLLKYVAPLPQNYKELKYKANKPEYFDLLYAQYTEQSQMIRLIHKLTYDIIPKELFGDLSQLESTLSKFITLKRFEDQYYLDYLTNINVLSIKWMDLKYHNKIKSKLIFYKRRKIQQILEFLFSELYIPFIRHNFYVTERMKDDWKLFYYRKEIWILISKLSIKQLKQDNFTRIQKSQITTPYIGKLRIMPKPSTFRPIITYKRKSKQTKKSLSNKLHDTKLVLRNLKHHQSIGFAIFDNEQVFKRLEEFNKFWKQQGQPQIYFQVVDITKCYDSIQLSQLIEFLSKSQLFSFSYIINKYFMIFRNNRPLSIQNKIKNLFNISERTCAIPLDDQNLINRGFTENADKPTIIINSYTTNIITYFEFIQNIKEICENNVVQFRNKFYLQRVGIPQGLNISGVLCSFYLANIEKQFINHSINNTLVMRLTDDYLVLSTYKRSLYLMQENFQYMHNKYNIRFNQEKCQTNLTQQNIQCKWIGKIINNQFQILPTVTMQANQKYFYQVNVNIPKYNKIQYLYNKLKSLILNQMKYYLNPNINCKATLIKIIKQFVKVGILKFKPFVQQALIYKISRSIFINMYQNIIKEIGYYCSQRNLGIDEQYLVNIVRKQFNRSMKQDKLLKAIIKNQQF